MNQPRAESFSNKERMNELGCFIELFEYCRILNGKATESIRQIFEYNEKFRKFLNNI